MDKAYPIKINKCVRSIIKLVGFKSIHYAFNLDIVLSSIVFSKC